MRDPFRPNSKSQLIREAQMGLSLVVVLLILFVYVAYYRIAGYGRSVPDHVRRAPVAESVWPNSQVGNQDHQAQTPRQSQGFFAQLFPDGFKSVSKRSVVDKSGSASPSDESNPVRQSSYDASIENQTESVAIKSSPAPDPNELAGRNSPAINTLISRPLAAQPAMIQQTIASGPNDPFKMTEATKTNVSPSPDPILNQPTGRPNGTAPQLENHTLPRPVIPKREVVENSTPPAKIQSASSNSFSPQMQAPRPVEVNNLRNADSQIAPASYVVEFENNDPQVNSIDSTNTADSFLQTPTGSLESVAQASLVDIENAPPAEIQTSILDSGTSNFHIVAAGESLWTIAQLHYNDGRYFRALYKHNQYYVDDVDDLVVGTRFETPPAHQLVEQWPEFCPGMPSEALLSDNEGVNFSYDVPYYETEQGDTLFEIARQRLGQASRYLEILELNSDYLPSNVNHLSPLPGQVRLRLPD